MNARGNEREKSRPKGKSLPKRAASYSKGKQHAPQPSLVVGIGASAGGLAAFRGFFAEMPADSGMAFVLVQHLDPNHKSALVELLARATQMPVEEAHDGAPLAPNCVYVIPPNATLTVLDGVIGIERPAPARAYRRPIDTLFASLGDAHQDRSVGIVLSGVGSDGSQGLSAIKEHGGLTLAQAEVGSTAMSGMPSSAVATGLIDFVLPVEGMPARLIEHRDHLDIVADRKDADGVRGDVRAQLPAITSLLRERTSHDFGGYKEKTLARRIQRRMQVLQLDSADEYVEQLRQRPPEGDALFRELDIGVTQFFRDPEAFEVLKSIVVPELVAGGNSGSAIRVWVPGCSTGEEVYSIAILLREAMAADHAVSSATVFGTDIDERAIAFARAARYRKVPQGVSAERLERWFHQEGGDYCPIASVREMCVFSTHSVVRDPPFSRLDLISCRNLLIYFDSAVQNRVMQTFHYALRPGGHLFLGTSESVTRESKLFTPLDKKHRILRRRDGARTPPAGLASAGRRPAPPPIQRWSASDDAVAKAAERALTPHSPVALVVDRNNEILRFAGGDAGHYLEPSPGAASLDLFGILRKELRPPVRAALQSVAKSGRAVSQDLSLGAGAGKRLLNLVVEPVSERELEEGICVVVLRERAAPSSGRKGKQAGTAHVRHSVHKDLRETRSQLQAARDELESYVEEMKSASEEYQSVNEELQSTNEELETAKEELQSVNEELQTINNELVAKNDMLGRLNSDLQNLLDSTQIATVFLDEDLHIRNFTPQATKLFPLRESDRGRAITDIVNLISYDDLAADAKVVLRDLSVVERELRLKDETATYIMRVRPYRSVKNVIEGVVLTFVDITERKIHDERIQYVMSELSHRTNNLLAVILSMARQSMLYSKDPQEFFSRFEARIVSLSRSNELLVRQNWVGGSLQDLVAAQLAPFADAIPDRVEVTAPPVLLKPVAVHSIGLALHELGTNASKHGALTEPRGRILVRAELHKADSVAPRFRLSWRETGGPSAAPPLRKGFGHVVLERMVPQQLDAIVALEFTPEGVRWTLDAPAGAIVRDVSALEDDS